MSTDRELLELAAKAAGYVLGKHTPEPELTRWSWHDLPELATALKAQRDALLEALDQCLNGTLIGGHTHNDNGLEALAERCGSPHVAAELRRLAGIARAAIKAVEDGK